MSLTLGTKLGPYEIAELAGRGGMGEVYRARDTRLKRDVAIKILPSEVAADQDRLARFQREAEALAALNHPNIAAIYAIEAIDGIRFLVMEYVDGDTLADRLRHGSLYERDATAIAVQICAALSAAHDKGIIHRDLKPANVKLTGGGQVKLLDFGLAKLTDPADAGDSRSGRLQPDLSHSPTMTVGPSGIGEIAGTAAYMAPEQARGKPVDKRADMWAFGCVLYEMLTGDAPFAGETLTDIVAAIVTKEPALEALPADTSPAMRWVIERCLQKDPAARLRDASDVAALLATPPRGEHGKTPASARRWLPLGVTAVAAAIAGGTIAALFTRPTRVEVPIVRFDAPMDRVPLTQTMALSPDGRHVAYVAAAPSGNRRVALWLQSFDGSEPRAVPGTDTARAFMMPAWSPDGRSIAYAADGALKRIDLSNGAIEAVTPVDTQIGGITWNRSNVIVFASNDHGLRRVPAGGGQPVEISRRDAALDETYHDCPSFLPDGRHFVYLAYSEKTPASRALYIGSLDSGTRTKLMPSNWCAAYANGQLVFAQGTALVARPFDAKALRFTGDAVPLAPSVASIPGGEMALFAVSDAGTIVYRRGGQSTNAAAMVWVDRTGKIGEAIGAFESTTSGLARLSPDQTRVAFSTGTPTDPREDIWVDDLQRKVRVRLTSDAALDHVPVWSPDGREVIFDSHRTGSGSALYRVPANGASPARLVYEDPEGYANAARDWSKDGRYLVIARAKGATPPWSLWILPLDKDSKPTPYKPPSSSDMGDAALSPDGRWLAYSTNESGSYEVVVQPFPDPSGGKWQVSTKGGTQPRWRRDGRELYFLNSTGDLMAVSVTADRELHVGDETLLFKTQQAPANSNRAFGYDTIDGQRFLVAAPVAAAPPPLTIVLNWPALLKQPR